MSEKIFVTTIFEYLNLFVTLCSVFVRYSSSVFSYTHIEGAAAACVKWGLGGEIELAFKEDVCSWQVYFLI